MWVEKYRPKRIDSCVLPDHLKDTLSKFVAQGDIPNLILSGGPGVGKTTVARAMLEELNLTYMFVNGSEESGIDVLRTKIKNFASTVSLHGGRKYLILDEADYLNPQSTQPALRGMIEEFHKNCGFILTCNYKNRLIPPLHSRCSVIDFNIPKSEKQQLAADFLNSAIEMLTNEGIEYEKKVIAELIFKHFPDWRRILNELQRYSVRGKIDSGILVSISEINNKELVRLLKEKRFSDMRKWVVQNLDTDPASLFRNVYDVLYNHLDKPSIPEAVLIIAKYQYQAAFVADHEINMVACLTEIMANCKFK